MSKQMRLTILTALLSATGFVMLTANVNDQDNKEDAQVITKTTIEDSIVDSVINGDVTQNNLLVPEVKQIEKKIEKRKIGKSYSLNELKEPTKEGLDFIKKQKTFPNKETLKGLENIYSLPRGFLFAVMVKESEMNQYATSHKNAKGLFQFTPATAKEYGLIKDGKDYRTNVWRSAEAAARYYNWIFTYLNPNENRLDIDNYKYTLAAYNAGIGVVKTKNGLKIPNYIETLDYVKKITQHVKGEIYIVKRGDKLEDIAKEHNLSQLTLSRLNQGVSQRTLIAGTYLVIKPTDGIQHTVKKGDSLYGISKRYSVSITDLKLANNLNNNMIGIGQNIMIPF